MLGREIFVACAGIAVLSLMSVRAESTNFPELDMLERYVASTMLKLSAVSDVESVLNSQTSALQTQIDTVISNTIGDLTSRISSAITALNANCELEWENTGKAALVLTGARLNREQLTDLQNQINVQDADVKKLIAELAGLQDRQTGIASDFNGKRQDRFVKVGDESHLLQLEVDEATLKYEDRLCETVTGEFNLTDSTTATLTLSQSLGDSPTVYLSVTGVTATIDENKPHYGSSGYGYQHHGRKQLREMTGVEVAGYDFSTATTLDVQLRDLSQSKTARDKTVLLRVSARVCRL